MSTDLLQARGLHKSHGPVRAVEGVDLEVRPGEFVAVVGRSGSGKSTLLNLLAGLDTPDEGEITFRGEPLPARDEDALADWRARHVGLVFQAFHLIPTLTARDNAAVPLLPRGPAGPARERAAQRLEQVGLGHRLHHRPSELSGGEQQRVAVARALVGEPDLLLADEPTGNLDTATGESIIDLFRQVRDETGVALVVITHDDKIARSADRRVNMKDGQVVA